MADFRIDSDAAALATALLRAGDELSSGLEAANARAGDMVSAAPAPRRTGLLAASVQSVATPTEVVVGSPLRYATFVHWGAPRRHVTAQPWLAGQVASSQSELLALYADHAAETLDKIG